MELACCDTTTRRARAIIGTRAPDKARIMHIRDTMHLEELQISEPCLEEPERRTKFEAITSAAPLTFDAKGNLKAV